jgi:hypothetical protein
MGQLCYSPLMQPRVRTEIFINGHIRHCQAKGAFATVARMGDDDAGLILLRIYGPCRQARLLLEGRSLDGARQWRDLSDGMQPEADIEALIARQIRFDPDLWVLDIEDRDGNPHLIEPIIGKDAL